MGDFVSDDEVVKVEQSDSRKKMVNLKNVETLGSNIKVIRNQEPSLSSESGYSESESEPEYHHKKSKGKKTKIIKKLVRKEQAGGHRHENFSAFSNPKKINTQEYSPDSESEYSSINESEYSGEGSEYSEDNSWKEKQKQKQDLLIKIQALQAKGFEFSKKFNMTSNYDEMLFEYNKIKHLIESQAAVKFSRRCLMACVTGLEFLNKKFDPFSVKLDGWSESVMESVDDYDNIFERLHEKYAGKAEIAPEIELLLTLGGSAFMFHLTNSLLRSPFLGEQHPVSQTNNNPNFMANVMAQMAQMSKSQQQPQSKFEQPPPNPIDTRGVKQEMRNTGVDPGLFRGTPLMKNYPAPPPPVMDDDRFSIASSDSDLSSVSTVSVKNIRTKGKASKNKSGGFELNII